MSKRHGPPKHQNSYAWKPNAGRKINETEVGGRFRPLSEITGVCPRCKEQIDWKRRYGKYKPLCEPAKCQRCSKRAVRQAYHNLCSACAKEHKVCAKCCCHVDQIIGRAQEEVEAGQKMLEEAIKNARERDRRTLLRTMNKGKSKNSEKTTADGNKAADLFAHVSLEDDAAKSRDHNHDEDDDEDGKNDNEENYNNKNIESEGGESNEEEEDDEDLSEENNESEDGDINKEEEEEEEEEEKDVRDSKIEQ